VRQRERQADVEEQQVGGDLRQRIRQAQAQREQARRGSQRQPDWQVHQQHGEAGHDRKRAARARDLRAQSRASTQTTCYEPSQNPAQPRFLSPFSRDIRHGQPDLSHSR
jgi:hypothetical protein